MWLIIEGFGTALVTTDSSTTTRVKGSSKAGTSCRRPFGLSVVSAGS
jgi:hypothetical protein